MAARNTATETEGNESEQAEAPAPAEAPKAEKAKYDGPPLYRFHTNAGTFRDGQETPLTEDEVAAYVPNYARSISGPGEAPSAK